MKNNIELEGARLLSEILRVKNNLQILDLGYNNIGIKGSQYLLKALKKDTTLIELKLDHNNIKSQGIKNLSRFLKTNTNLQKLDLSYNDIADGGIKLISNILKINTTLRELNLEGNTNVYKKERNKYLYEAMLLNTSIQLLYSFCDYKQHFFGHAIHKLIEINKDQQKYSLEIEEKNKRRIKYFDILWQPKLEINRLYPLQFRNEVRVLISLIYFGSTAQNELSELPVEIWIQHIIPHLADSYVYDY